MTADLITRQRKPKEFPNVFLSHNSKDKASKRLPGNGIRRWFDKWDLAPGDTAMEALERAVKSIPCAALFFGPADVGRWHIMEVRACVEAWAGKEARMIPMILPSVDGNPDLPMFVRQTL